MRKREIAGCISLYYCIVNIYPIYINKMNRSSLDSFPIVVRIDGSRNFLKHGVGCITDEGHLVITIVTTVVMVIIVFIKEYAEIDEEMYQFIDTVIDVGAIVSGVIVIAISFDDIVSSVIVAVSNNNFIISSVIVPRINVVDIVRVLATIIVSIITKGTNIVLVHVIVIT